MRGLYVLQPYAQLMALGAKRVLSKRWGTRWRGHVAIQARTDFPQWARNVALEAAPRRILEDAGWPTDDPSWFPTGAFVCVSQLLGCCLLTPFVQEQLAEAFKEPGPSETVPVALPIHQPGAHLRNGDLARPVVGRHELHLTDLTLGRWLWVFGPPARLIPPEPARGAPAQREGGLFECSIPDWRARSVRAQWR